MRICLTVHGFPPFERTGVENYTRSLAAALVRAGHVVEVFAPCPPGDLPNLALRREVIEGVGVNWLAAGAEPKNPEEMLNPPGIATRFGAFLDRERPDVVHFQHVVKLGTSLIGEAKRRNIPTVYTAHDYYAHCHRYTLLRPDLTRCETPGDPELCSRCDQALAVLNGVEELGDYQMGAFPDQLEEQQRVRLSAALRGDTVEAGFTVEDQSEALDLRKQLDKRRAEDFGKLDRILAPTLFLRDRLIEGGLEPDKIEHLPYGIETGELVKIASQQPVRQLVEGEDKPLRIGFFGGFSKHKGVHVLLEAFSKVRGPAELSLHGLGSDRPYVKSLRKQADEVGARWCGPYDSSDLPALLADVDVVVVPSLWVENYPIVIREALAAGRPVITSRLGALSESVRDGIDGLLFEPGNASELAELLERCISENGLLKELVKGIGPVHDIGKQVTELSRIYEAVVESVDQELPKTLPTSLRQHVKRYRDLNKLPTRELFQQAMDGLQGLSSKLLAKSGPQAMELYAKSLARRSNVQNLLRDRRRESDWVKQTLVAEEAELETLTERLDWMRRVADGRDVAVKNLKRERGWLEQSVSAKKEEVSALASEKDEQARALANLDEQREWLKGALQDKKAEIEELTRKESWFQSVLDGKAAEIEELEKKSTWLEGVIEDKNATVEELDKKGQFLEGVLESSQAHIAALEAEKGEQVRALEDSKQQIEALESDVKAKVTVTEELEQSLAEQQQLSQDRGQNIEAREATLRDRDERIERHEAIERELRAWLESSRDILEAFNDEEEFALESNGRSSIPISDVVVENWESVLSDVERLLDSEGSRVAPDELGRRVEAFLDRLDTQERELDWRRGEMSWIAEKANRTMGRFSMLAGQMRERVRAWAADPSGKEQQ